MSKKHMGSSIDDFRKEDGVFERELQAGVAPTPQGGVGT
jgi:hypothetical protein